MKRRQSAFTLVEIVVTIVVIGISATALLSVFSNMIRGSADPVIQQQATTIAEAYLEEIMLKAYDDPQVAESGGQETGESRPTYDDVQDYNSLPDNLVRDQNNKLIDGTGAAIADLSDYTVAVTVNSDTFNAVPAMRVEVTVSHPAIDDILLTGFRANF